MSKVQNDATLFVIKVGKKLFYNTPVHRSKIVNGAYKKIFFTMFKDKEFADVTYFGHQFNVPTRDITILPSLINNDYESFLLSIFTKVTQPGMTFVDVGANIGIFSIIGAERVGVKGNVFSFEPVPQNFSVLKLNIKNNKLNNIVSENVAVGDKREMLKMEIARNSIGTHSLLKGRRHEIESEIQVEVIKLDDYFTEHKVKIDVMKIDVEGYEPQVLRGAKKVLRDVKMLFFEYSKEDILNNSTLEELCSLLKIFPYLYLIDEKSKKMKIFTEDDFHHVKYANLLASKKPVNIGT